MPGAGGKEVGRISIRVVPDLDGFREEVRAALTGIPDEKVNVDVDADTAGVREKIEAAAKDADVKIKPKIDKSDFEKALAEAKAAAKSANVKLDVDFKDGEAEAKLAGLIARLKAEAAAANIKLRVDTERRGIGGGGGFGGGGGGLPAAAGGGLSKFSMLADDSTLIVAGIVTLLAPALGLLATSLASLPALISAVALPIGAVALGMGGFKKALENVGLLGEDKKGKTKAGEQLKALQKNVSDEFERGLTPVFQQLVTLLPAVTQGFTGIARGIVADIQGLTDAFTKGKGPEMIGNIFRNVGEMLSQAAPGLNSFASGLLGLASQVSGHLPGLSRFFDEFGSKFSNWVSKISGDGTLDKAVSGLRPVLDSVATFVGKMMDSGIKLMADPAMAQNIKAVLDSITNVIVAVLPALNEIFKGIADTVRMLGLDKLGNQPNKPGLGGGVPQLHPPRATEGDKQRWDDQSQKGTGQANMPGWFDPEGWGNDVRTKLLPKVDQIVGQLKEKLSHAWDGLVSGAQQAWSQVVSTVTGFASQIGAAVQQIPAHLSGIWNTVVSSAQSAWNGLVSAAQSAVGQVIAAVQRIPGAVASALGGLASIGLNAGKSLVDGVVKGIEGAIGSVIAAASKLAGAIASHMPHSPAKEGPLSGKGWTFYSGQSIAQGLADGMDDGSGSVVDKARALAQSISDEMNNGMGDINSKQVNEQIKQALAGLDVERDKLQAQKDALPKGKGSKGQRDAISGQLQEIKQIKDQLGLGRDQMKADGLNGGAGGSDSMSEAAQMITKGLASMLDAGKNFVMGNVSQFEHDIGIGGKGAIPTIANFGIGWAQQEVGHMIDGAFGMGGKKGKSSGGDTHFHVNSVDEAIQGDRTRQNQKALQWKGR